MGQDWRGRAAVAAVSNANDKYAFGRTGGAETHTLTANEMPGHRHVQTAGVGQTGQGKGAGNNAAGILNVPMVDSANITRSAGGSQAHNNMPPYVALYFCKKE